MPGTINFHCPQCGQQGRWGQDEKRFVLLAVPDAPVSPAKPPEGAVVQFVRCLDCGYVALFFVGGDPTPPARP